MTNAVLELGLTGSKVEGLADASHDARVARDKYFNQKHSDVVLDFSYYRADLFRCRIGGLRGIDLVDRISRRRSRPEPGRRAWADAQCADVRSYRSRDLPLFEAQSEPIKYRSLRALGRFTPSPVGGVVKHWRKSFKSNPE